MDITVWHSRYSRAHGSGEDPNRVSVHQHALRPVAHAVRAEDQCPDADPSHVDTFKILEAVAAWHQFPPGPVKNAEGAPKRLRPGDIS